LTFCALSSSCARQILLPDFVWERDNGLQNVRLSPFLLSVYRIIIGRDASGKEMVIQKRAHRCLTGEGDKKTGPCLVKDRAPEDGRRMGGKLQEALPFKGADPRKASVPAGKLSYVASEEVPEGGICRMPGRKFCRMAGTSSDRRRGAWTAWIGRRVMSHRQRDDITPTKPKTT
jgi:hypothetical protein